MEEQSIGIENLELIFVDDASTDDGATWNAILDFEAKYPNQVIAIQHEENKKQGGARNTGLRYASAKYVGFVDPDDWIEKDMYKVLYDKAVEYDCEVVCCRMYTEYATRWDLSREMEEGLHAYEKNAACGGDKRAILPGGVFVKLYRKSLILDNSLWFPEKIFYEDNYWGAILSCYVKRYYAMNDVFYHYCSRNDSTVHSKQATHHLDRIVIEERKLEKYREIGVFERCYREIEIEFLQLYYINTLTLLARRWEEIPYEVYVRLCEGIEKNFPDYQNNPYLKYKDLIFELLLPMIAMKLSEAEWVGVSEVLRDQIREIAAVLAKG
ncbi:glycosyl transferase [Clostridia bacterium]|nr:glycosyl transferase [Clostridia bacterium]